MPALHGLTPSKTPVRNKEAPKMLRKDQTKKKSNLPYSQGNEEELKEDSAPSDQ